MKWVLIPHPFQAWSATDYNVWLTQQGYSEEYGEPRGKGSFPAMITPAYLNAKKANELASDVSTILGQPIRAAEAEKEWAFEGCAKWNRHTVHVSELSWSKMVALNSYPNFWHLLCLLLLFIPSDHIYLLQRRLTWTSHITYFVSAEASTKAGPAR